MTIPAKINEDVTLVMVLEDGNESMYPQAEIYGSGDTVPVATVDLEHKTKGRYEGTWVPTVSGAYTAHFFTYIDAIHSVESIAYTREAEQVFASQSDVDDLAAAITRILGLTHENSFIDNTSFDASGQLVSARVRLFDSKANAELATDGGAETTGLVATYTIASTYEAPGKMATYRMVKE